MKPTPLITTAQVAHVAHLAKLPVNPSQLSEFQNQIEPVLEYVKAVQDAPTKNILETTQVTGLTNVLRKDEVDNARTFTQEQALSNAQSTHNGFFMVPAIME